MASFARRLVRKTKNVANTGAKWARRIGDPLSVVTDPVINSVIPGYSQTATALINPVSNLNQTIMNPLQASNPLNVVAAASESLNPPGVQEQKKIPNRAAYSQSASKSAASAEAYKAKAEREKNTAQSIANAQKAAAEAGKARAAAEKKKAEESAAVQKADQANATGTTSTAATDAAAINATTDTTALLNALLAAREGAAMDQYYYLPEQEVQSDYTRYFIFGGFALAAIWLFTRNRKKG